MDASSAAIESAAPAVERLRASRLRSIDVLRAVAALSVMLIHARSYVPALPSAMPLAAAALDALARFSGFGVPLFFVISGFCIHLRWAKTQADTGEDRRDFLDFWRRRIRRLYPPYLVALTLCMLVILASLLTGFQFKQATNYPEPRLAWWGIDYVAHALMLHGLSARLDSAGGNGAFWTLAREEYFYLMYFLLLAWRRRWGTVKTVALSVALGIAVPYLAAWALRVLAGGASWWELLWYPVNATNSAIKLWMQWTLGFLAIEAYFGLVTLPRWCYWFWLCPVGLLLAYLIPHTLAHTLCTGFASFVLINWCVSREQAGRWGRGPLLRWLARVGLFSYSMYLVHMPALAFFGKLEQMARAHLHLALSLPYLLACFAFFVAATYWTAKCFFLLVERWFLNTPTSAPAATPPPA